MEADRTAGDLALTETQHKLLLQAARKTLVAYLIQQLDPAVAAAKAAASTMLQAHELHADAALQEPAATFVTLWRRTDHELRGCRGECIAHEPLIDSVTHMALASATDDPRFDPVTGAELPLLRIEISRLTPLHPIRPADVVIGRDGLLVELGRRRGLLLPQVAPEHGLDREGFLRAVCWKAGLPENSWQLPETRLYAFTTEVWTEP